MAYEEKELLKKKIIILGSERSEDGKRIKIKANDTQSYGFFVHKQDGSESKAYTQFKQGNPDGVEIGIAYTQTPSSFVNKAGKTVNYTRNDLAYFIDKDDIQLNQDDGRPQYQGEHPKKLAPMPSNLIDLPKRDFTAEAEGKCRYGFLLEAFKNGTALDSTLLKQIEGWVEASMTGEMPEPEDELRVEDLPPVGDVPNGDQEITVDDIPF